MTERLEGRGKYFDIPGTWIRDKHSPDGWRFIATAHGWKKMSRRNDGAQCQTEDCPNIGCEYHHIYGRGGGKREDRIVVANIRMLIWLCRPDHDKAKIKRREPLSQ